MDGKREEGRKGERDVTIEGDTEKRNEKKTEKKNDREATEARERGRTKSRNKNREWTSAKHLGRCSLECALVHRHHRLDLRGESRTVSACCRPLDCRGWCFDVNTPLCR